MFRDETNGAPVNGLFPRYVPVENVTRQWHRDLQVRFVGASLISSNYITGPAKVGCRKPPIR